MMLRIVKCVTFARVLSFVSNLFKLNRLQSPEKAFSNQFFWPSTRNTNKFLERDFLDKSATRYTIVRLIPTFRVVTIASNKDKLIWPL